MTRKRCSEMKKVCSTALDFRDLKTNAAEQGCGALLDFYTTKILEGTPRCVPRAQPRVKVLLGSINRGMFLVNQPLAVQMIWSYFKKAQCTAIFNLRALRGSRSRIASWPAYDKCVDPWSQG